MGTREYNLGQEVRFSRVFNFHLQNYPTFTLGSRKYVLPILPVHERALNLLCKKSFFKFAKKFRSDSFPKCPIVEAIYTSKRLIFEVIDFEVPNFRGYRLLSNSYAAYDIRTDTFKTIKFYFFIIWKVHD